MKLLSKIKDAFKNQSDDVVYEDEAGHGFFTMAELAERYKNSAYSSSALHLSLIHI